MRYQGGKSRIATPLANILRSEGGGCFVSLFCGSCAVESKVTGYERVILNDKHEYLIAMLRGVQAGYDLPETITEEQYQAIRANKDADPVLTGFVGFGCSFGGKWWGGVRPKQRRYQLCSAKQTLPAQRYGNARRGSICVR